MDPVIQESPAGAEDIEKSKVDCEDSAGNNITDNITEGRNNTEEAEATDEAADEAAAVDEDESKAKAGDDDAETEKQSENYSPVLDLLMKRPSSSVLLDFLNKFPAFCQDKRYLTGDKGLLHEAFRNRAIIVVEKMLELDEDTSNRPLGSETHQLVRFAEPDGSLPLHTLASVQPANIPFLSKYNTSLQLVL